MRTRIRKKTYNLDEELIQKVRKIFDAKTDTEAIQKALKKAADDLEIEESLEQLLKNGRFRTVYK